MKKLVIRLSIAFVILIILAALAVHLFLDSAIKRGVETMGPKLAKVEVKLKFVNLALLSGSGKIRGLTVGNPEGFKSPSAIQVGVASVALQPSSLLSDKIVVHSIELRGPEITYETDLRHNNLSKILANLEESTGGGGKEPTQPKEASAGKKLEVDDFIITGGKIHVSLTALGGESATVPLTEIHLTDLGKESGGITAADLSKKVLAVIVETATKDAAGALASLETRNLDLGKSLSGTNGAVNKVTRGIGELFKKK